jgi:hypothetical protein
MFLRFLTILLLILSFEKTIAQQAIIKGTVTGTDGEKLFNAEIIWVEGNITVPTNDKGHYSILVSPGTVTLKIRYESHKEQVLTVELKAGEKQTRDIKLEPEIKSLNTVTVEGSPYNPNANRNEVSTLKIDPKTPKYLPSAFGDFNKILATVGMGVVSNSELSSQYAVRGGNFDENLVYVNDMEVYRPFLVRAGQQEGLSFVNPDMVSDIEFSAGGWQPKYGDKLSSVLAIKYKEPKRFKGSATLGILGFAAHVEGRTKNRRVSYVIGARNKNSQYLLNTMPTKGEYKPRFYDIQSFVVFDLTHRRDSFDFEKRTTLSVLTSYAINEYNILPTKRQTTFGTLSDAYRLEVVFDGKETMNYNTLQNGLKLSHIDTARGLKLDFMGSAVHSAEREFFDIETIYKLCEIETAQNSANFNECILTKGSGSNFRHARNELQVTILTLSHKGQYDWNSKNQLQWGISEGTEIIKDKLSEYSFDDSAQYITITEKLNSTADLTSYRTQGYIQHTWKPDSINVITYGVRVNYWSLNNQVFASPRLQYAIKPRWKRDVLLKAATGVYQQPAFYREMRAYDGSINKNIKAQTSYHIIVGSDYNFKIWKRNFKFISELYYKYLTNVIPYDMDNVRLRYYALNNAKAYATGIDLRVSGEFIKGEESWFSLSLLDTREDVEGDSKGYIRRPSDQRLTAGIFFQDHIPNNPSLKMYLNFVYGTGLPFGPPKLPAYRSAFDGPSYNRVDIGFSKLVSFQDKEKLDKKGLESVWISLEILNLLGAANTISYTWVRDFDNNQYAVPNTLSARFVNLRMIARF